MGTHGLDVVEAARSRLERLAHGLTLDGAREAEDVGARPGRHELGVVRARLTEAGTQLEGQGIRTDHYLGFDGLVGALDRVLAAGAHDAQVDAVRLALEGRLLEEA